MKSKPLRFSSHVQLQYLIQKYAINQAELVAEMTAHFKTTNQGLKTTKSNKVTAVVGALKPITYKKRTPKSRASKPQSRPQKQEYQPAVKVVPVAYKKKRFIVKPE